MSEICPKDGVLTQRSALKQLNSHFDPLGLWSPFFLHLKWLYSRIAKAVGSWDDVVPVEIAKEWETAMEDLKKIQDLKFPRCYTTLSPNSKFEIHAFSDASQEFIGAGVYLRVIQGKDYGVALMYGKSRVISAKEIENFSIARKELLALVMASDLVWQ